MDFLCLAAALEAARWAWCERRPEGGG